MAITKIESYEVMYSANSFVPRIWLLGAGNTSIGTLMFMPDGTDLPPDNMLNGHVVLYYHLANFQHALDLLRNEAPMYLLYNGTGGGFENGIKTTEENVGEGERRR
jgi:hypothetical protein